MTPARRPPTSAQAAAAPPVPLLRLSEVTALLGVKIRTLQSWRAAGRLRVVAFSKRCVRVERAEVERLIREARS